MSETPAEKAVNPSSWEAYRRLLGYVKPFWPMFLLSFLGFALYAGTQTASAKWLEHFIDAIEKGELDKRTVLALAVMGIFFMRGVGTFIGNYGIAYVARYVINNLRIDLFNRLLVLPSSFYGRYTSGELLSRLTFNVEQVTGAATDALKVIFREGLTVIGLFSYMLYLNWKLTLLFLVIGPVVGAVVALAAKRLRKLSHGVQDSIGDISHVASEAIKGFQVVRLFGGVASEQERFESASRRNRHQFMKMVVTQSVSTPIVQLLVASVIAILTFVAMQPSLMADMSTGGFIAFISAASLMAKPIRMLTEVNQTIQRGIAAAESVFTVLDEDQEPDQGRLAADNCKGALRFNHLSFSYEADKEPVLKDIELDIEPGQSVALVGKSGSGKSTLVSLLPRFLNAGKGELLLDGQPIEDYALQSLREQIAIVNQQVTLFSGSIAENIAYGGLAHASREQIEAAAEAAHVMEFVKDLPDGLDTMVGENGVLLSGGQRQRIAIARAVLKDAPILILDEATSALDTESERHIQQALDKVMVGRTTVMIAHRLSTIEGADKIVVMDHGQIIEQGKHDALLEKQGAYAALHNLQYREAISDGEASH